MPLTPPSWPLAKAAWYAFWGGYTVGFELFQHLFTGGIDTEGLEWRRVVLRFTRTGQDDIVTSLDILNITSSEVDISWTTTDYTDAETLLDTFVTAWKPFYSTATTLAEYRWYRMAFNPIEEAKPFVPSVVPARLTNKSIAGTGSTALLPPQCRCVVTELTILPHHWGRMYMPLDGLVTLLTTGGQLPSASVTTMANAVEALYEGLWGTDLIPCVPVTQVNKAPTRALLNVTGARVDSIVDIQRRGRPENPSSSVTKTFA